MSCVMVVRTLENLENLEMSGKNKMVRDNLENLEKSGNFLSLCQKNNFLHIEIAKNPSIWCILEVKITKFSSTMAHEDLNKDISKFLYSDAFDR